MRRSRFNLSYENKFTCPMGKLIPFYVEETLPGDSFTLACDALIRFAPLIAPVMHNVDVYFQYFYVPNRILWDNGKEDSWEAFITQSSDTAYKPFMSFRSTLSNKLTDYLGVPHFSYSAQGGSLEVDALYFRAYSMIWNHWYRDERLSDPVPIQMSGGLDTGTNHNLLSRAWEKDYFTSAFTSPQAGSPVRIPLTGDAPLTPNTLNEQVTIPILNVYGNGKPIYMYDGTNTFGLTRASHDHSSGSSGSYTSYSYTLDERPFPTSDGSSDLSKQDFNSDIGRGYVNDVPLSKLSQDKYLGFSQTRSSLRTNAAIAQQAIELDSVKADLSDVTAVTIDDLRTASSLQRWYEKSMRYGSRYVEQLMSFFGVRPRDSRLQIPEYLGGFKSPLIFSEVLQTSQTNGSNPLGSMGGHGFSTKSSKPIHFYSSEHGILMGLLSVMPRTSYYQGLPRRLSRFSATDYYFPEFQNVGEQEIKNKEIYANTSPAEQEGIFGYQQRYAEYKMRPSEVHGDFKDSLSYWHMGRTFDSLPSLNDQFVQSQPTYRIFTETQNENDKVLVQLKNFVSAKRPMAKYSKPSLK